MAWKRFYRSRSLRQGQRSDHDVAHLHPLTNVPTKYQLPTSYGFRDTGRTISFPPPTRPDTMGENNTPTALKGCGVKNCQIYIPRHLPANFMPDSRHLLNRHAGHFFLFTIFMSHSPFRWQINAFLFWTVRLKNPLQLSHVKVP